ncbi:MAG: hypothetical protein ABI597_09975, partial [Gammaproteobacteria bacterium]
EDIVDKEEELLTLAKEFNLLSFEEQAKIIKEIGPLFVTSLPESIDWNCRWQAILYLTYLERVGTNNEDPNYFNKISLESKVESIPEKLKNGIKCLVKWREKQAPKIKFDLGCFAIVDFEELTERCAADFPDQIEFQIQLFKAAEKSLVACELVSCITHTSSESIFNENYQAWMDVAKIILNIADLKEDAPLISNAIDNSLSKLVNFIGVTLCNSIGLTGLRVTTLEMIHDLCKMYLSTFGDEFDNEIEFGNFKVERKLHVTFQNRLHLLITHISLWSTTLKPFASELNAGFNRILNRTVSEAEVLANNSHVVRAGFGRPASLTVTYFGTCRSNENDGNIARMRHNLYPDVDGQYCSIYSFTFPYCGKITGLRLFHPNTFGKHFANVASSQTIVPYQTFELAKKQMVEQRRLQMSCYNIRTDIQAYVQLRTKSIVTKIQSPITAHGDAFNRLMKIVVASFPDELILIEALNKKQFANALRKICSNDSKIAFSIAKILLASRFITNEMIHERNMDQMSALDYAKNLSEKMYNLLNNHLNPSNQRTSMPSHSIR